MMLAILLAHVAFMASPLHAASLSGHGHAAPRVTPHDRCTACVAAAPVAPHTEPGDDCILTPAPLARQLAGVGSVAATAPAHVAWLPGRDARPVSAVPPGPVPRGDAQALLQVFLT
jgi:hypothetical protein